MKPFPINSFLHMVREYEKAAGQKGIRADAKLTEEQKVEATIQCDDYIRTCNKCALPSTADQFKRIRDAIKFDEFTATDMMPLFTELLNRLQDECERKVILALDPDYVAFYKNPQFFDHKSEAKVSEAFPSANEDIAECGKCLACRRATACVLHLNRVLEVGLRVLASAVGVGKQNDWGKYITEIDEQLKNRAKNAGARSADEQFYSEANAHFDIVRRAWRNPTMHVDRTYSVERAQEIMFAVRTFMRHLATRLSESR